MILITPELISDAVLQYHFRELYQFSTAQESSALSRLVQICPDSDSAHPLVESVLSSSDILQLLTQARDKSRTTEIINFSPSSQIEALGNKLNISIQEKPEDLSIIFGSKSGNKSILSESDVPTPAGCYEIAKSEDAIKRNAFELIANNPHIKKLIIKLNDGSWGDALGNAILDKDKLIDSRNIAASVERSLQPWRNLIPEIIDGGAIIEEYVEGAILSPSSQGFICEDGTISIISIQEQILVKDQYLGCISPPPENFLPKICESVQRTGKTLYRKGVRGSFGIDFIGFEDDNLLATEINIRKVGTSHAISYVESIIGKSIDSDGMLRTRSNSQVHYVHRRFFEPLLLKGIEIDKVLHILRKKELLYNHDIQAGVILHILSAVKTCGYVEITSISNSRNEAFRIDSDVQVALGQLKDSLW